MTDTDPENPFPSDSAPPEDPFEHSLAPIGRIVGYFIIWWLAMAVASSAVFSLVSDLRPTDLRFLSAVVIPNTIATLLVTWVFVSRVDGRPIGTLGLSRRGSWLAELGFGMLLGLMLPCVGFLAALAAGWIDVSGSLFTRSPVRVALVLLQTLVVMTGIAVTEEVAIRGYVLQNLRRGYGAVAALIVSSLLFGFLHLMNPGAGASALGGTLAAGLVLGYAYLTTERLWLPIGFHFGWNFALGPIFGFPVSGIDIPGWLMHDAGGPLLWTGGAFGPEAGLLGIITLLMGAFAVRYFSRRWHRSGKSVLETTAESPDDEIRDSSRAA